VSEAYVPPGFRGRAAAGNPPNRFERLHYEPDPGEAPDADDSSIPKTELFRDATRSILTRNDSPDVPFTWSVNPYRGCEHGCIYCYARPTHEYLGFSAGLDFETRILVKEDAPRLLREGLLASSWKPETVVMSGVTDCYQPAERKLGLTRRCLEVFAELRHPVAVITKSELVTRDLDLLAELARHGAAGVSLSVTTLDEEISRAMEPRAATPARRLAAIRAAAEAGIPCGVMLAPVIPGLTDHEMPAILAAAREAGARTAGFLPLRLPFAVAPLFAEWLERRFPLRKEKVLARVREIRGGALNDPRFGSRMTGEGPYAKQMRDLFDVAARKAGLAGRHDELSTAAFRRPPAPQLELFGAP
jgi:DNA repair photolyase